MNNPYPWAGFPNTSPAIAAQTESAYLNYNKTKQFDDVGWFLESYVVSGGVVTKDVTLNNQIDVTEIVVSIADSLVSRDATSFKTSVANTTYYLDFTSAGDFAWGTSHPTGTQNTDWIAIATVTTDTNANVSVITDVSVRGGFRLKDSNFLNNTISPIYNVLGYGAKGDGVTDDTAALQTLINTAIAAGRKAIFFPHTSTGGKYLVTALTNADKVVLFGDNASFVGGYTGLINQLGEIGDDYVNVKDFGAVGDNVTDDTTAIINAINSIPVNGRGVVIFPEGSYKVTQKITIANRGVAIVGVEKITSTIYFYNCDGFEHTGEFNFTIRDIGLYTNGSTFTAIKIPYRLTLNSFELSDVDMWGFPYGSANWGVGIYLEDISNTWIYRHTFIGDYTNSPFADGIAVKINSTVAKGSTGHHMLNCTWNYCAIAVQILANNNISIEGVRIDTCGMVGVIKGVVFDGSLSGYTPPLFTMTSSHVDLRASGTAVELLNVAQADITSCDLYGFNANDVLIKLTACTQVILDGNFYVAGTAASTTAISVTTSSAVQVNNNQFNGNWTNGIVIDAASTMMFENNNKYLGTITNKIVDSSGKLFTSNANRAVATISSAVSVPTATATKIPWSAAAPNWGTMWSNANATRITIPTGVTRVRLSGQARFNTEGTTGSRQLLVLKNNAYVRPLPIIDTPAVSGGETTIHFSSGIIPVVVGDYLEMQVNQTSGVTVTLNQGTTFFEVEVIDYYTN